MDEQLHEGIVDVITYPCPDLNANLANLYQ